MSELTDYVIMPGSDYQNICNSIRSKTGGADLLKSGEVSAAIDSIQANGGGIEHKDVNFYDYDGTLLHSYTVEEAANLTELPTLPSHEGLICQGWNYDLETIKSYGRSVNIGAMYITDDGKTRLYISIDIDLSSDITLNYGHASPDPITIDWGDGIVESFDDVGTISKTHTYTNSGDYIIKLSGSMSLGFDEGLTGLIYNMKKCNGYNTFNTLKRVEIGSNIRGIYKNTFWRCYSLTNVVIPNGVTSIDTYAFSECYSLTSIVIPNSITSIGNNAFSSCYSLTNVVIPNGITSIDNSTFGNCYSLINITIPNSITSIGNNAFSSCYSLTNVVIPNGITSITLGAFGGCYSLTSIVIPNSITSIGGYAFSGNVSIKFYDFSSHTSVPTLGLYAFDANPSGFEIRVPAALYDEWVAATNWSTYASNIVAV